MQWISESKGFDEAFAGVENPRSHYQQVVQLLGAMSEREILRRERLQDVSLLNQGITFNVYGEDEGVERVFPFDLVPRIIPADEWKQLERGLVQRVTAINLFLLDVYTEQRCLHDGIIPWELVLTREDYRREVFGVVPPRKVFTHVVGTDLIRDDAGTYRVLEDNCRCPSGVSYVLENRNLLQRTFPELFASHPVRPVRNYPRMLLDTLAYVAPRWSQGALAVVLSPGPFNSAYFEHSFLAREMGVSLVEGRDLVVEENHVYVRTTEGKRRVEVIYRRIDDDFLDPLTFDRESILGVPGLISAYRDGNVAIANAPGAGVADDKAVYAYVPALVKYYLDEEPLLQQVPTYTGFREQDFKYMMDHLDELVVKTTSGAGGYGMLMGPFATKAEIAEYGQKMRKDPSNYIAQPLVEISSHPTHLDRAFRPRRVDLRPFILFGDRVRILPGGLTRVALREGSYVVNSSQGGGSKDTWVLEERAP
ncbi:MAG: circularly permuted type 2 ATP-grasp protein [Fimbriimonadaceae bacterium]|nr:circularly permuted type 2 ATP-grasp protein [Chthonomonadaceae bacterium]MCO5298085.1 circularly permuted type 2 ATP-grasp protein [Fimbriimonadaceae bacterium]